MTVVWVKQSASAVISLGPFLDKTDGVTEETGLVSALDHASTGIKLAKNGGALTIRHATVTPTTYDANGFYRVTLDATDTNTLGLLLVSFNEAATCLPVWLYCAVLPANVYDSLVGGSDYLAVDTVQFLGSAVLTNGTPGVIKSALAEISVGGLIQLSNAVIGKIAENGFDADSITPAALDKIAEGLGLPVAIAEQIPPTDTNNPKEF